ncbi:CCA tRNA nucleotidyltransferase, mitochondrial [Vermiconidia calcicola]|uniref:CCA tRNA nucleotidyltransferase, mitochondrial n=1 Tax=Vermiconidia calcicola TaxID=1690605 RepID=A0ACC3MBJ3_9PEZI|nr:CCA tRNA nucleotidyltransferase, mitochondrial [Vermiconidia calcicola]
MVPMLIQEVDDDAPPPQRLELTPVESTLRRLLLDVAAYIDHSSSLPDMESQVKLPDYLANEKIVLRFTGGWVRDKLLGVDSHDIDVAINKMTGYQFGLRLKEYLENPGNPEKYGLEGVASSEKQSQKAGTTDKSKTVGGLHKIEANPEKSKHLETVTTKILGLDIDLVNLRKETYTEESRNPQMEFGTPEEDAMRRDATVNAMFYNVNTEQVEDFTGRGHDDMRAKRIRTPLEPYQTFKDDPLRVLRLIRFASRLDYTIDAEAQEAMRDPEIQDALKRKISRERIGIEVEKALRGPDPHEALRLMFDLDLYETIFSDPTVDAADHYEPNTEGWQAVTRMVRDVLDTGSALAEILIRDREERFYTWQLAALVPYNDAPLPEPPEPGRRSPPPIAASIAREGIKSTNKVCDIIAASVRNVSEISSYVDKLYMQKRQPDKKVEGEDASARDVLGMAIRRWGSSWRSQVMYSMLVEVASSGDDATPVERKYTTFVQHLRDLDIVEAYTFKPLMDGKALAKALDTPPGPWMKDALDVVMAYQLRHPNKANAEDAIAEVQSHNKEKQNGGELTSSLVRHFLKLTIRPLFVKAKPSSVTDTGRKNTTTVLPKKMTAESMDETVSKPWKAGKDADSLHLLRWCVQSLDERLVEEVWPLIVPPLLTLVDDWETRYKRMGAGLVGEVLQVTPPTLLAKTGLGDVFEDALTPCLTFLPTITPQEESIPLLDAVYPTLLTLAKVRYPKEAAPNTKHTTADTARLRIKFLDTIIRKGIIHGYTHCSNYPHIVSTLFTHLVHFLKDLGIESVKHLKYVLPMLTETLSHPLADAQTATLLSATKAMQAVILNGWPRMGVHRGEVLKGLTLCWIKLADQRGEQVSVLRDGMRETVQMLKYVTGEGVDFEQESAMLIEADPRVGGLLL